MSNYLLFALSGPQIRARRAPLAPIAQTLLKPRPRIPSPVSALEVYGIDKSNTNAAVEMLGEAWSQKTHSVSFNYSCLVWRLKTVTVIQHFDE
eukprot:1821844-Amphidinium_carterae.1